MMVESLKHEGTSHSSSDLLKICVKVGASWSAQDFRQAGVTVWAWCLFPFLLLEDLAHLVFADLNCRCVGERGIMLKALIVVWRGVQSGCGVFFFSNLQ